MVYVDPHDSYSICYPKEFTATGSDLAVNIRSPRNAGQRDEPLTVVISSGSSAEQFYGPPSPETCEFYTDIVEGPTSSTFFEVELANRLVPACFTVGPIQSSLHATVPVALDLSDRDGGVNFAVMFISPDLGTVPALGLSILETLRLGAN